MAEERSRPSGPFRSDIQGLRTIAVLAVIADHLLGWPHGGFVGVDIFFVISGFLITGLLVREYIDTGSISFLRFYERRVKRILPVALFVLFVTVLLTYPFWGLVRTKLVIKDAIASALFMGNWQFARNGVDYFQQDMAPSPLQHYWSLSVEEQFYFVWPWLLLGILLLGARWLGWQRRHTRWAAGTAISLLSLASLAWSYHETASAPTRAYFSTLSRVWELGVGALLAIALPFFSSLGRGWARAFAALGAGGLVASLFLVHEGQSFPAPWAMLPVLSTALLIAAGSVQVDVVPLLGSRPSRYLGDISYSLYLWHFPVAVLLPSLLPTGSGPFYVVGLALVFGLSAVSYRWLEDPARKADWFRWSGAGRFRGLAGGWWRYSGGALAAAAFAAGTTWAVNAANPPLAPQLAVVLARDTGANPADCFGAAALDPNHRCAALNPAATILPRPADAPRDAQGAYECYITTGERFRTCSYGSQRADAKLVALIGDSHAASLLPALQPQLDALNWRLEVFIGRGCKWTALPYDKGHNCLDAKKDTLKRLLEGTHDLIIATGTRTAEATSDMHKSAMQPLLAAGRRMVVIDDNPDVSPATIACVQRVGFDFDRECWTPKAEAYAATDQLTVAARELNVPVVYQDRLYCTAQRCPAAIGNVLVYKDVAGHVTASYAKSLGPYLVQAIQNAVGGM